jgi:hypothetical protein
MTQDVDMSVSTSTGDENVNFSFYFSSHCSGSLMSIILLMAQIEAIRPVLGIRSREHSKTP